MFKMVADWFSSKQIKREFLKDKTVGEYKFNYWIRKYRDQDWQTKDFDEFKEIEISHFDRLNASHFDRLNASHFDRLNASHFDRLNASHFDRLNAPPIVKSETSRKIEITTPSGFLITIVEEC
jgi:hypothetical protein